MFKTELRRTEASDVRSGFTSVGPHRDDLEITLGGLSARMNGSQRQQRSAELAMKLAVRGMMPRNVISKDSMSRLKIYRGAEHPHAAQKPEVWDR